MTSAKKKCVICGCQDHKLIGCINHKAKNVVVINLKQKNNMTNLKRD